MATCYFGGTHLASPVIVLDVTLKTSTLKMESISLLSGSKGFDWALTLFDIAHTLTFNYFVPLLLLLDAVLAVVGSHVPWIPPLLLNLVVYVRVRERVQDTLNKSKGAGVIYSHRKEM